MYKHSIKRKNKSSHFGWAAFSLLAAVLVVYPIQAFSRDFKADASIEKSSGIREDEKITLNFSLPMATNSVMDGFSILPKQDVNFSWENNNKRLVISPQKKWKSETSYAIRITKGKNIIFKNLDKTFNFDTQKLPKPISFWPANGETNVAVDIEDPVRISFNRTLDGYHVKFVVSPMEDLGWQLSEDNMHVSLLAKNNFKWDTRYTVSIFMKNNQQGADEFVKVGETYFDTAAEPAPEVWEKDPVLRIVQAKKFTKPLVQNGKYIDINLSKQMMVIFEDSKPLDAHVVSSGKRGMETPEGSFSIQNKAARVWSKKYSLFMPYWMAILPSGEVGIHELPEWPGGFKEGASHLGTPVSHGCVRLGVGSAKRVYEWAEIGTPVIVHQ